MKAPTYIEKNIDKLRYIEMYMCKFILSVLLGVRSSTSELFRRLAISRRRRAGAKQSRR